MSSLDDLLAPQGSHNQAIDLDSLINQVQNESRQARAEENGTSFDFTNLDKFTDTGTETQPEPRAMSQDTSNAIPVVQTATPDTPAQGDNNTREVIPQETGKDTTPRVQVQSQQEVPQAGDITHGDHNNHTTSAIDDLTQHDFATIISTIDTYRQLSRTHQGVVKGIITQLSAHPQDTELKESDVIQGILTLDKRIATGVVQLFSLYDKQGTDRVFAIMDLTADDFTNVWGCLVMIGVVPQTSQLVVQDNDMASKQKAIKELTLTLDEVDSDKIELLKPLYALLTAQ